MNIYLIGYRGSGKTALGKELSKKLNRPFTDLDTFIEEQAGMKIPEIFSRFGEAYFRELEENALRAVSKEKFTVVSTGGGIVTLRQNREIIRQTGTGVYLKADPEVLYQRIKGDANRPALTSDSPEVEIRRMLSLREPYYKELAEITIDTGELDFTETLARLLAEIKKIEDK